MALIYTHFVFCIYFFIIPFFCSFEWFFLVPLGRSDGFLKRARFFWRQTKTQNIERKNGFFLTPDRDFGFFLVPTPVYDNLFFVFFCNKLYVLPLFCVIKVFVYLILLFGTFLCIIVVKFFLFGVFL